LQNPLYHFIAKENPSEEQKSGLIAMYDEEISYLDFRIGKMFDFFESKKLLNDALIIITADHGEHFGEHGLYSHVASLYEPIIHIPLIIKYPQDWNFMSRSDSLVQLIDIVPTVLDALHIAQGPYELPGQTLLKPQNQSSRLLLAEWEGRIPNFLKECSLSKKSNLKLDVLSQKKQMIRQEAFKSIRTANKNIELYNISVDPLEMNDISKIETNQVFHLQNSLNDMLAKHLKKATTKEYELSEKMINNLT
jgi:arylsulfatase A-like enzyme